MELLIADQTRIFLHTVVLGLALGHVYDLLRCVSKTVRGGKLMQGIFDLVFCACALVSLLILMLTAGEGEMRWYIPGGAALGLVLYFLELSNFVRAWMTPALHAVSKGIHNVKRAAYSLFSMPRGN